MENILLENITDEKICDIANLSSKLNAIRLNERCLQYLSRKPQDFVERMNGFNLEFKKQLTDANPQN